MSPVVSGGRGSRPAELAGAGSARESLPEWWAGECGYRACDPLARGGVTLRSRCWSRWEAYRPAQAQGQRCGLRGAGQPWGRGQDRTCTLCLSRALAPSLHPQPGLRRWKTHFPRAWRVFLSSKAFLSLPGISFTSGCWCPPSDHGVGW